MAKVGFGVAHNPSSPGAGWEGFHEHPESVIWTGLVEKELIKRGHEVFIGPIGRLGTKVNALNQEHCGVVIEIHFNACGGCGASGCETLYYPRSRKGLFAAEIMQEHLCAAMNIRDRGIKEGWYQMNRSKGPDYFLEATNCTALILEPEFIEHKKRIISKREAGARAIADAIEEIV